MLRVQVEKIGDMAVVECEGRVVRSDAAFRLRNAVTSLRDVRIIVIDLSEVRVIEGGGLGMLTFLGRWAQDHDIQFKLFNPTKSVRDRLEARTRCQRSTSLRFMKWWLSSNVRMLATLRLPEGGQSKRSSARLLSYLQELRSISCGDRTFHSERYTDSPNCSRRGQDNIRKRDRHLRNFRLVADGWRTRPTTL
jgi:anti-anti-sigma regulatory factor